MTGLRENGLTRKEQLFRTLRRDVQAARLKVTLDEQLGREAPLTVRSLAGMKLTPRVGPHLHSRKVTEHGG